MKKFALLLLLLTGAFATAQTKKTDTAKAGNSEWDQLDKSFAALIQALEKQDAVAFKALSLGGVDCIACVREHQSTNNYNFVSSDVFFETVAPRFTISAVYKALMKRGYTFDVITIKDYKPVTVPKSFPKDLKLYEVWVPTYLANELSKGHPGSSNGFQFVKIDGKFKFYGLTSIP